MCKGGIVYKLGLFIERGIQYLNAKIKLFCYKVRYGKRVQFGKGIKIRKRFNLYVGPNAELKIGDNVFFNNDCSINCMKKIEIGNDNLFGENVKIYDHNHIFNRLDMKRDKNFTMHNITIGNNNWFGSCCVILSKSNIGNNNVFSAGTVINENIENDNLVSLNTQISVNLIKYKENK